MGGLGRPLLPGIDLDHAGDVERVDPSERVRRYEHDARIRIDLFLGISETDGLQDWRRRAPSASAVASKPRQGKRKKKGGGGCKMGLTGRLVEMRQVGQVVAGFQHGRVHQRRQRRVVPRLEGLERDLHRLGLQAREDRDGLAGDATKKKKKKENKPRAGAELLTSPFSSWSSSRTLSPSTVFLTTSDATQPSVGSGCQTLVPTS